MRKPTAVLAAVAIAVLGAGITLSPALSQTAQVSEAQPARIADTSKGKALVDSRGMTLYTFDKDSLGKSACTGTCAQNWPPLMAGANATPMGDWTVVSRDDGTRQWAYKGKPLYTWAKDTKPGDTTGDGVNGVWHIAKP